MWKRNTDSQKPWVTYAPTDKLKGEPSFYDPNQFDWAKQVTDNWTIIRDELVSVIENHDGVLAPYKDLSKVNNKDAWKTAGLMYWTFKSDRYIPLFPKTWDILSKVPNLTSASLLLLEPKSTIKPHYGDTNCMYRCHMGLIVPAKAPQCGLKVDNKTVSWEEGKLVMFNDALEHTAWNNTDERRYILSFDVTRDKYEKYRNWTASQVLGNIYVDVSFQHKPLLKRYFSRGLPERIYRAVAKSFFRTLIFLRLPLYDFF